MKSASAFRTQVREEGPGLACLALCLLEVAELPVLLTPALKDGGLGLTRGCSCLLHATMQYTPNLVIIYS